MNNIFNLIAAVIHFLIAAILLVFMFKMGSFPFKLGLFLGAAFLLASGVFFLLVYKKGRVIQKETMAKYKKAKAEKDKEKELLK